MEFCSIFSYLPQAKLQVLDEQLWQGCGDRFSDSGPKLIGKLHPSKIVRNGTDGPLL